MAVRWLAHHRRSGHQRGSVDDRALYERTSKELGEERIKLYGWINGGFNVSTSDKHYGKAPAAYYVQPNSIQLDQAAFYIDRLPDTVQTDHFDWGFRFTQFYGLDHRFTAAKGYFSQQLLLNNNKYGYDPVMACVDLYWGPVAANLRRDRGIARHNQSECAGA